MEIINDSFQELINRKRALPNLIDQATDTRVYIIAIFMHVNIFFPHITIDIIHLICTDCDYN